MNYSKVNRYLLRLEEDNGKYYVYLGDEKTELELIDLIWIAHSKLMVSNLVVIKDWLESWLGRKPDRFDIIPVLNGVKIYTPEESYYMLSGVEFYLEVSRKIRGATFEVAIKRGETTKNREGVEKAIFFFERDIQPLSPRY